MINGRPAPRPPFTDVERLAIFRMFLNETPEGLLRDRAHAPDYFPHRLAFEAWRSRWLPYLAGLSDRPTSKAEYMRMRHKLFSGQRPDIEDVDRFHTDAPPPPHR